ncbi:phosphoribosyltransferase [Thermogemmatispora sp.]|jgi:hypoxanthine phosphoribosyltransferase|uniref:phosphoribosyltransferase n=1 Tax=Thermogemmatispora sp. TaxID=1968838 RepID=UPI0035E3F6EA
MEIRSYDYARRRGVRFLSWEEVAHLSRKLGEALAQEQIEAIVGIARAGLFPATLVACALRLDLYPVRVSRRLQDEVRFSSPVWHVPLVAEVAGKRVAVVDEIADSGETLTLVAEQARALGAAQVVTAALVSHSWARPQPARVALLTDELVVFPWDQQVLIDGTWQLHPEIVTALAAQHKGSS